MRLKSLRNLLLKLFKDIPKTFLNRTGFDGDSQLVSSISEVSLMVAS